MFSNCHRSLVCGAIFALFITVSYIHPTVLCRVLNRQPLARTLGWHAEPTDASDNNARMAGVLDSQLALRSKITWDLIRGRMSLAEAASHFQLLATMNRQLIHVNDRRDSAGMCRHVIHWVAAQGEGSAEVDLDTVLCRLEAELHELSRRDGPIELPPVRAEAFAEVRVAPSSL